DEDGPYIELMAGVYTDNQPDFTWLKPFEEKTFTQYFLPYRELGVVKNASKDILLSLDAEKNNVKLKVFVTSAQELNIKVMKGDEILIDKTQSLHPEDILEEEVPVEGNVGLKDFKVFIYNQIGKEVLKYDPADDVSTDPLPEAAKPALQPAETENNEQLFLTGQHLEQYRHATYRPMPYYLEAIKRDSGDIRSNNAVGLWYFRKGLFDASIPYFEKAIETITSRNPNPYNCEPYYNLGLALFFVGNVTEAYDAFFKAAWDKSFQDVAYHYIAQIDLQRGDFVRCLEHINWALDRNARNGKAYVIKAKVLNSLGFIDKALEVLEQALKRDVFNLTAFYEKYLLLEGTKGAEEVKESLLKLSGSNSHNAIEYAIDYLHLGAFQTAIDYMELIAENCLSEPLINYYLGYAYLQMSNQSAAMKHFEKASKADPSYCFPNRLQDIVVLKAAIANSPEDGKAPYYLGNLYYDKQQYDLAISLWEKAAKLDGQFPTVHRNLGLAYYNKKQDQKNALKSYETAFALDPKDARVLMELDSLYKKLNKSLEERLEFLKQTVSSAINQTYKNIQICISQNPKPDGLDKDIKLWCESQAILHT
ncbi:MAG: tetratricopeptide repeat protein, partial [Pedobacter sp.]|nr:tetratricopeptide repeat protein [Pedobacter sp.]